MRFLMLFTLIQLIGHFSFAQSRYNSVYFDFDVSEIESSSYEILKKISTNINDSPIVIKGYTDTVGSADYNKILSQKRVQSVTTYLLKNGVKPELIKESIGFGESDSLSEIKNNRRVDIIFIQPDPIIKSEVKQIVKEKIRITVDDKPKASIDNIEDGEIGETLVLKNLEFIPGRHDLQKYSKPVLKKLLNTLEKNPNIEIEIQGHICCQKQFNEGIDQATKKRELSVNRAKFVYEYLVKNGISETRLSYKGYGVSRPLVKEVSQETQQMNRRVEIMITNK